MAFNEKQPDKNGNMNLNAGGTPGNAGGRPLSITRLIREALEREGEKEAIELAAASIKHSKAGNAAYFKEVLNRIDGPLPETVNLNVDNLTVEERREEIKKLLSELRDSTESDVSE